MCSWANLPVDQWTGSISRALDRFRARVKAALLLHCMSPLVETEVPQRVRFVRYRQKRT